MIRQLTPTETHNILEIVRAHAVEIEKLGLYERMARDGELRHLFAHAGRKMRQHYEELRSFGETGDDFGATTPPATAGTHAGGAQYGGAHGGQPGDAQWTRTNAWAPAPAEHPQPKAPWVPSAEPLTLSDRVMCTDLLEFCKHMAVVCTMAALEASHATARRTFKQLAVEHVDLGYEVYHYMEKNGWYGTRNATMQQIRQMAQSYQPVQQGTWGGASSANPFPSGVSGRNANFAGAGATTSGWPAGDRNRP